MYKDKIEICPLQKNEFSIASQLCKTVFLEFNASTMSSEGQKRILHKVMDEVEMLQRLEKGHHFTVAKFEDTIKGLLEIRPTAHVVLLYVDGHFQGKGIGQQLIYYAVNYSQNNYPHSQYMTLNSSRVALVFYEKLGFEKTGEETIKDGINYIPMQILLKK